MDPKDGLVKIDIEAEKYKINIVNEYELTELDTTDQTMELECSLQEI